MTQNTSIKMLCASLLAGIASQASASPAYTAVDLGTFGGTYSHANAINASGQVVGAANINDGATHAFLYSSGAMVDLNTLLAPDSSWVLDAALLINDAGQIVANDYNKQVYE